MEEEGEVEESRAMSGSKNWDEVRQESKGRVFAIIVRSG